MSTDEKYKVAYSVTDTETSGTKLHGLFEVYKKQQENITGEELSNSTCLDEFANMPERPRVNRHERRKRKSLERKKNRLKLEWKKNWKKRGNKK